MGRTTAKNWTKSQVKNTLADINTELTKVIKGGDPTDAIAAIKKHIKTLEQLVKPPKFEPQSEPKPRIPVALRKRIETGIKRNYELLEALEEWKIS